MKIYSFKEQKNIWRAKFDNSPCKGLKVRIKGWSLAQLLRLQCRTWQVHIEGQDKLDRFYAANKRFLLCFWHGKYLSILPLLEGYDICVITNRSERGNVIAEICRKLGYKSAQMPDKLRLSSFRTLLKELSETAVSGVAVDGPLGPRHDVKTGVAIIASAAGFDLLPVSVDFRPKRVLKKRWDQMEVPLPFSTVCLVIGEPVAVPATLSFGQIRDLTDNLAETITQLDKRAETMVAENRELWNSLH